MLVAYICEPSLPRPPSRPARLDAFGRAPGALARAVAPAPRGRGRGVGLGHGRAWAPRRRRPGTRSMPRTRRRRLRWDGGTIVDMAAARAATGPRRRPGVAPAVGPSTARCGRRPLREWYARMPSRPMPGCRAVWRRTDDRGRSPARVGARWALCLREVRSSSCPPARCPLRGGTLPPLCREHASRGVSSPPAVAGQARHSRDSPGGD